MTEKLLRVNVAAKRLGVSTRTVYRLVEAGHLQAHDVGSGKCRRTLRIPEKAVNVFLQEKITE